MKHYLLTQHYADGTTDIQEFTNSTEAMNAYIREERRIGFWNEDERCCLFGSDSIETLKETHGSWFMGPMLPGPLVPF